MRLQREPSDVTPGELENKPLPDSLEGDVTEEEWEDLSPLERWLLL